jgi:acyl carrier protein
MNIISSTIITIINKMSKKKNINLNTKILKDLNFDSLDYVKLLLTVEKKLNTKVLEDGVDWSKVVTVKQLENLFKKNLKT